MVRFRGAERQAEKLERLNGERKKLKQERHSLKEEKGYNICK